MERNRKDPETERIVNTHRGFLVFEGTINHGKVIHSGAAVENTLLFSPYHNSVRDHTRYMFIYLTGSKPAFTFMIEYIICMYPLL